MLHEPRFVDLAPEMWELYAMWTWIGVFLAESLQRRGGASYLDLNASSATFFVIAIGALGCYVGGVVSGTWAARP